MHDFGKFCYLDVPKTGSSFISKFLNKHSTLDQVGFHKHRRLRDDEHTEPGKFFFISVREPLDQYKSLYFYGVNGGGALFSYLDKEDDLGRFYDGTAKGFSNWLEFVIDPKNLPYFSSRRPEDGRLFGPMTHRFLRLSFFQPSKLMKRATDFDSLVDLYQKNKVHRAVVKNESLNMDMADLVDGPLRPFIKNPDSAIAELRSTRKKINQSGRSDKGAKFALDPGLLAHLRERERFLFEVIGYDHPA